MSMKRPKRDSGPTRLVSGKGARGSRPRGKALGKGAAAAEPASTDFDLPLDKPEEIGTALSPAFYRYCAEAAAFCLAHNAHQSGARIAVNGSRTANPAVRWAEVTEPMKRTYADWPVATEHGAYALAMLLIPRLTDYEVVERSKKGPGFDFWLNHKGKRSVLFQHCARLEVSGILQDDEAEVRRRVKKKMEQLTPSDGRLPGWVVVVEFSAPRSVMVEK